MDAWRPKKTIWDIVLELLSYVFVGVLCVLMMIVFVLLS